MKVGVLVRAYCDKIKEKLSMFYDIIYKEYHYYFKRKWKEPAPGDTYRTCRGGLEGTLYTIVHIRHYFVPGEYYPNQQMDCMISYESKDAYDNGVFAPGTYLDWYGDSFFRKYCEYIPVSDLNDELREFHAAFIKVGPSQKYLELVSESR